MPVAVKPEIRLTFWLKKEVFSSYEKELADFVLEIVEPLLQMVDVVRVDFENSTDSIEGHETNLVFDFRGDSDALSEALLFFVASCYQFESRDFFWIESLPYFDEDMLDSAYACNANAYYNFLVKLKSDPYFVEYAKFLKLPFLESADRVLLIAPQFDNLIYEGMPQRNMDQLPDVCMSYVNEVERLLASHYETLGFNMSHARVCEPDWLIGMYDDSTFVRTLHNIAAQDDNSHGGASVLIVKRIDNSANMDEELEGILSEATAVLDTNIAKPSDFMNSIIPVSALVDDSSHLEVSALKN